VVVLRVKLVGDVRQRQHEGVEIHPVEAVKLLFLDVFRVVWRERTCKASRHWLWWQKFVLCESGQLLEKEICLHRCDEWKLILVSALVATTLARDQVLTKRSWVWSFAANCGLVVVTYGSRLIEQESIFQQLYELRSS